MTDGSLQAELEDDYETELSRLGSSKALYALTDGEMETEAVRSGLADWMATAAATFEGWTDGGAHGGRFEAAAATATDVADRIAAGSDGAAPTDDPTRADEVLRHLDDPDARLGGLLAWAMVADRTLSQAVGFFVGNADPSSADLFRDLRSAVDAEREAAADALAGADEDAAREAASRVVEVAYEDYVEALESMGVKVKPVC